MMHTMHCTFTKSQGFPLGFRVYSQSPKCYNSLYSSKLQSLLIESHPKLRKCSFKMNCTNSSLNLCQENMHFLRPSTTSVGLCHKTLGREGKVAKPRNFSSGFRLKHVRGFSSSYSQRIGEGTDNVVGSEKALPWLAKKKIKDAKRSEKSITAKTSRSSWEEVAQNFLKGSAAAVDNMETRRVENRPNDYRKRVSSVEDEGEGGDAKEVNDPRWDKIKNRFGRITDVKPRSDRPEFRRWDKQENWGQKTWKEATESTLPKMVGEGIYGVGPVLAALSAGRRELYALYIQEGLDLSSNNRKKKDKKGFEKVLRIAEKLGLSKKEVSKHDLNMIADNRPHQGLVLDASPLEMVSIRELDPVLDDEEKGLLWVALDEVTDPQNLGAIIRSAYFFGAAGVVLCAKNSAPLSGVVSKASAGSLELTELRSCRNMMQFLVSSAENGWRVLGGSVSSRAVPLNDIASGAPTILVLGSEGTGLRPLVERSCTQLIRIPGNIPIDVSARVEDDVEPVEMNHNCSSEEFRSFLAVESLNVSVAAGVLLHHLIGSNHNFNGNSHIQDGQTNAIL